MKFGSGWSWLKILPLWIAIMSGILSIVRETYGMFAANPVDPKSIFWGCARIAFILSAAIAWWQEHQALVNKSRELENALKSRDEQIEKLTSQPRLQPHEIEKQRQVRALIADATEPELEFLKYLANHQELHYEKVYERYPRSLIDGAALKWHNKLIAVQRHPVTADMFWSIAPGLKDALSAVLYNPSLTL